jgi:site-specific DNA-methyltransferase (adenine-specific)
MRLKACKEIGLKEIPIIVADEWTEEQKNEFLIKDNVGFGEWDWDSLANEWDVEKLEDWGLDLPVDLSVQEELEAEEDDYEIPYEINTDIVIGDLFEIGEHRLLCGDSTDSDQVAKLMNGEKADMVFTDPPYSITTQGGGVLQKHFTKTAERIKDIVDFEPQEWLHTLPLYFNGNMNCFIFCNKDLIPDYLTFAKENKYNFNILVWCKKQVVPFTGGHHFSDIEYIIYLSKNPIFNNGLKNVEYRKYFVLDNEKSKDHPTIKPLEIISNEIQIASNKNGIVAECFTGSGSTMVASHQLKRKCYGMELDPKYCQVIIDRMKKLDPSLVIKKNGVELK